LKGRNRIRFCVLASGSKGNAVWVEEGGRAILVDNGLSGKELLRRMAQAGLDHHNLDAIVVSHEHRDHISGVGVAARLFNIPVYISQAVFQAARSHLGKMVIRELKAGWPLTIGCLEIHPYSQSHDAVDPIGFTFNGGGKLLALATDLGVATHLVKEHLKGCRAIILEANHDPQMLIEGPYPWEVKRRVQGRQGHLSNMDSAELLTTIVHRDLRHVILAHLSETNNHPELALETMASAFSRPEFDLTVAKQKSPGPVFEI
jgi:phosphoribosyl 1,2-cyclic phosphodiesterase